MRIGTVPVIVVATGMAVALAASGCTRQQPRVAPAPTPTVRPVFATDAEALAAAEKAYAAYVRVSTLVAREGGKDVGRFKAVDTPRQLREDKKEIAPISKGNRHIVGQVTFSHFKLKRSIQQVDGRARVDAYVCLDISATRLISKTGTDITPARDQVLPLEVTFLSDRPKSSSLLVDWSAVWPGDTFCS